ncbi:MAG: site-specific integrase [Candidatus Melainabacteria bacterium]|nr:site-specific integrase [Candidatus Melainabacteria bacterium]
MERFFKKPHMVAGLRCGPLASFLDEIAQELQDDGYATSTARFQLIVASDFSGWLERESIQTQCISRQHSTAYMRDRDERGCVKREEAEAAINRLFEFLARRQIISEGGPAPMNEIEQVVDLFGTYLLEQRGLASRTVVGYRMFALRFLRAISTSDQFVPSCLCAANIFKFVQEHIPGSSGTKGRDTLNAVRSFLRFARYQEYINTNLASIVPRVASWNLASIPKALPADQIERVLDCCDRSTKNGKRDYAILILLARLGLRVGEVASLCFDDIEWESGTLTVRGKTGPRVLPLPADVGEALSQYICDARPQVKTRAIFIRLRAPVRAMKSQESFCAVVRRAMERARIRSPKKGAHQFRHGLATELLRKGASIPEIGELLGHQQQRSTMIYAKVDLKSLRKLAMKWPGGAL